MKTYTKDEIKRRAIDSREVFRCGNIEFLYSGGGQLLSRIVGASTWASDYILSWPDGYTIPADNEKPAELPESVRKVVESVGWIPIARENSTVVLTALWAETVKLVEGRK